MSDFEACYRQQRQEKYREFRKMPNILECEKKLDEINEARSVLVDKKFINDTPTLADRQLKHEFETQIERLESIIFLEYALFEL